MTENQFRKLYLRALGYWPLIGKVRGSKADSPFFGRNHLKLVINRATLSRGGQCEHRAHR